MESSRATSVGIGVKKEKLRSCENKKELEKVGWPNKMQILFRLIHFNLKHFSFVKTHDTNTQRS